MRAVTAASIRRLGCPYCGHLEGKNTRSDDTRFTIWWCDNRRCGEPTISLERNVDEVFVEIGGSMKLFRREGHPLHDETKGPNQRRKRI